LPAAQTPCQHLKLLLAQTWQEQVVAAVEAGVLVVLQPAAAAVAAAPGVVAVEAGVLLVLQPAAAAAAPGVVS
jgi:hypothetical protein